MRQLEDVKQEISECTKCSLCETRINTVPGEGPSDAKIMLIGEAAGAKEDETGRPFIGRSGQLLTKLLREAGIDREDVFVTSILKCRPPSNRAPSRAEVEVCSPYLFEQMEILAPKVVCLLGNVATRTLLGISGISKLHGKPIEKAGINYLPTYHPAAALRNPHLKIDLIKDLRKLKELSQS